MKEPKAVLWDMDGTLINSEQIHWVSWRNTMANEGVAITRDQFLSTFGQRNDSIIPGWIGPATTPDQIARIAEAKEELYRHLVRRDGVALEPGVEAWLHRLDRRGWRQAIASAAPRANIEAVLEAVSADHFFQAIVSAEDVLHGKPDPEVYLLAASRLDVPAVRCIVVEDAVSGIEGARRAGMRSVGIRHNGQDLRADLVVESLELLNQEAFEELLDSAIHAG